MLHKSKSIFYYLNRRFEKIDELSIGAISKFIHLNSVRIWGKINNESHITGENIIFSFLNDNAKINLNKNNYLLYGNSVLSDSDKAHLNTVIIDFYDNKNNTSLIYKENIKNIVKHNTPENIIFKNEIFFDAYRLNPSEKKNIISPREVFQFVSIFVLYKTLDTAFHITLNWSKSRKVFGKSIIEKDAVFQKLFDAELFIDNISKKIFEIDKEMSEQCLLNEKNKTDFFHKLTSSIGIISKDVIDEAENIILNLIYIHGAKGYNLESEIGYIYKEIFEPSYNILNRIISYKKIKSNILRKWGHK